MNEQKQTESENYTGNNKLEILDQSHFQMKEHDGGICVQADNVCRYYRSFSVDVGNCNSMYILFVASDSMFFLWTCEKNGFEHLSFCL